MTKIYTRKSLIIITLICIFLPKLALATNWVLATFSTDNNIKVYIDADSIVVQKEIRKYWTKWDYKEPQVWEGKIYTTSMKYMQTNCSERTTGIISLVYYDSKGNVVTSATYNPIDNKISSPPNSIFDFERKAVCELKK